MSCIAYAMSRFMLDSMITEISTATTVHPKAAHTLKIRGFTDFIDFADFIDSADWVWVDETSFDKVLSKLSDIVSGISGA